MRTLIAEYEAIVKELEIVNTELLDCREAEPYYLKLLNFIKQHPDSREFFVNDFVKRVQKGIQPWEVTQFCMRELQWPEIKEAVIERSKKTDDWRIISVMNDIFEVYESVWEDADLYKYYEHELKDKD